VQSQKVEEMKVVCIAHWSSTGETWVQYPEKAARDDLSGKSSQRRLAFKSNLVDGFPTVSGKSSQKAKPGFTSTDQILDIQTHGVRTRHVNVSLKFIRVVTLGLQMDSTSSMSMATWACCSSLEKTALAKK